jgi:hypothetical protein
MPDSFEIQYTPLEPSNKNHEWRMEAILQTLFEATDNDLPHERIRPLDLQTLTNSLKFRKACGIAGSLNKCLRHRPRRQLVHLRH